MDAAASGRRPPTCRPCSDGVACVRECSVKSIFTLADVPQTQRAYIAPYVELPSDWPILDTKGAVLPEADEWKGGCDKLTHLVR